MAAKRGRAKKPAYHHGDLRNALLRAGRALLAEGGGGALSLREAARRAGVSHAAPYRHFASKEALLAAIAEEGFRALGDELGAALAGDGDPLQRLGRMGQGYVRFALAHPAEVQSMFAALCEPGGVPASLGEAATRAFGLLVGAVEACQRAGLVLGDDPLPAAVASWAVAHGLGLLLLQNALKPAGLGAPDAERATAMVVGMLRDGLRAR